MNTYFWECFHSFREQCHKIKSHNFNKQAKALQRKRMKIRAGLNDNTASGNN